MVNLNNGLLFIDQIVIVYVNSKSDEKKIR